MSDKLVNVKNLNDLAKKLDKRTNDNIAIISEKINEIEEFVNEAINNIPEGFSGDYNDLENRPCYDDIKSIECTYDGNATGRVIATEPLEAMVKVSDEVIDYETYLKSVVGIHYPDGIQYHNISDKIEGEDYFLTKSKDMIWGSNVTVVYEDNVELWGAVFPEKGIYFHDASLLIGYGDPSYTCSFIAEIGGELKQLDEKFIPDTIATKEYVDNAIAQASIGGEIDTTEFALKSELFSGDYNDLENKPEIPTVTNDLTDELKANYDTAYERSISGMTKMYCIDGSSGSLLAAHAPSTDRDNAVFYSTKAYITSSGSIGTDGNINAKAFYEDGTALENKYVTDESLSAVAKSGSYNDLTNKPTASDIGAATEEYVDNSIAEIVNSAPETLNTLNELAQALGDDPNFATTMATEIGKKADKNDLFSKDYNDLTNKPEIPSIEGLATEELVNNLNNDVVENINEINTELETKASTEFVNDMLSGLRLVQMTQSEYDALEVKDSNTLYIIVN